MTRAEFLGFLLALKAYLKANSKYITTVFFAAGEFGHPALKSLFLTCNDIDSFSAVQRHLGSNCPNLQCLSLSECPLADVPAVRDSSDGLSSLVALNVNQV